MTENATQTQDEAPELIRVQHAVFVKTGANIRALNDLLSTGWRVTTTTSLDDGVLIILETFGTPETIAEMRAALGYAGLDQGT